MTRLLTSGAEFNDLSVSQVLIEGCMYSTGNAPVYDTTFVRTGTYSFKFDSGGSNLKSCCKFSYTGVSDVAYYMRAYIYLTSYPTVSQTSVLRVFNSGETAAWSLALNPSGTLNVLSGGTAIGSASRVLALNTWYRIELKVQSNTTIFTSIVEGYLDGVLIATTSSQASLAIAFMEFGLCTLAGANSVLYLDDIAINEGGGAGQTGYPGEGNVVLLLPISDNAAGSWKAGSAASAASNGALYAGIDNIPPLGTASPLAVTVGISNNVSGATSPNGDFNFKSYEAAGITGNVKVTVVEQIIVHGEDISTTTKTGTFNIASNPTTSAANVLGPSTSQFGPDAGAAVGTYPSFWIIQRGAKTYDPVVTLSTSPVGRITKTDNGTRAADICFMGILVEYSKQSLFDVRTPKSGPILAQ
jgi:hypothetical protein